MAGRHAKPIELHLIERKKHLTKAEIKFRKEAEIKIGDKKLICPAYVKKDSIAFMKWKELKNLFKDIEFVSSSDVGLIGRYCITFSQYLNLIDILKNMNSISENAEEIDDYLDDSETFSNMTKKRITDMITTDGIMRIESAINKKMDVLIKIEDRLFLNPLAKIKNIPKKEPEKEKEPLENRFENV